MRQAHQFRHRKFGRVFFLTIDGKAQRWPDGSRMYWGSETEALYS